MINPKQIPKPLLDQINASQYEQDKRFEVLLELVEYLFRQHFPDVLADDHPEYITGAYLCVHEWHLEILKCISDYEEREASYNV